MTSPARRCTKTSRRRWRSRLHRRVAIATEHRWSASRQRNEAAAIAYHYAHSSELPDAGRGSDHAMQAASAAEATYADDEAARLLQLAITLLPEGDVRTPRLLLRLARAESADLQTSSSPRDDEHFGWTPRHSARRVIEALSEVGKAPDQHLVAGAVATRRRT